jgi:hypothetical protein
VIEVRFSAGLRIGMVRKIATLRIIRLDDARDKTDTSSLKKNRCKRQNPNA